MSAQSPETVPSPLLARAVGTPFRAAAALRHAKAFHPDGRLLTGSLVVDGPILGVVRPSAGDVTLRLSQGAGLPGGLPDVLGIALRVDIGAGRPWDLLLASSTVAATRVPLPVPARTWSETTFSSLTPFEADGAWWWIRAQTVVASRTAAVPDPPVRIRLSQARGLSPFRSIGEVEATDVAPVADIDFDPVRNLPADVRMAPAWLARTRRSAYDDSRRGRRG
ncbi:hypothetical protein [Williamsia deligens]|uniref:Phosphodiesterase n=1 Tax=Williamsia deligens TaxID=321325 RepID=A0ABW3G916_9NOCA|nr:hypothetical protein [Williamsia deligens]MCP2195935.1 hypothetical protein [Williamsia deligens]